MNETSAVGVIRAAVDNSGDWRWMGDGYADEDEMLDVAALAFEEAFADGGWDEERVTLGCRLAWGAAWRSVRGLARTQGWRCESVADAREAVLRLDGANGNNASAGGLMGFVRFCAAEGFYERAHRKEGDRLRYYPEHSWLMMEGVGDVRRLIERIKEAKGKG